jgi:predicted MFS family arabinose efflux permease
MDPSPRDVSPSPAGRPSPDPATPRPARFPLAGLIALAAAAFITILTEALPAGLLPEMSADLGVSESRVGMLVTVYAVGSAVTAIPLTALTRGLPRRSLLIGTIVGFAVANTVTTLSHDYALTIGARLVAGVAAGLLWALLAGYAMRMVAPEAKGRALAVAMAGAPVALSAGIPAATLLGQLSDWRIAFGAMSAASLVLIVWLLRTVPPFPGEAADRRQPIRRVVALPGLAPVLLATGTFVLAHSLLYTYIAPLLELDGNGGRISLVLFVFGFVSLAGVALAARHVDRRLRSLALAAAALFVGALLLLGVAGSSFPVVLLAAAGWGLAFGGAGTFFQAASANAAGPTADVAQSMVVTVWNVAIALGALLGGVVVDDAGPRSLPWLALAFALAALLVVWFARRHGFPGTGAERDVEPDAEAAVEAARVPA